MHQNAKTWSVWIKGYILELFNICAHFCKLDIFQNKNLKVFLAFMSFVNGSNTGHVNIHQRIFIAFQFQLWGFLTTAPSIARCVYVPSFIFFSSSTHQRQAELPLRGLKGHSFPVNLQSLFIPASVVIECSQGWQYLSFACHLQGPEFFERWINTFLLISTFSKVKT